LTSLGLTAIEACGVINEREHIFGKPKIFHDCVADASAAQRHLAFNDAARDKAQQLRQTRSFLARGAALLNRSGRGPPVTLPIDPVVTLLQYRIIADSLERIATKSTGTMLMRPPSVRWLASTGGNSWRMR